MEKLWVELGQGVFGPVNELSTCGSAYSTISVVCPLPLQFVPATESIPPVNPAPVDNWIVPVPLPETIVAPAPLTAQS
jgi:hypothetical protein